jgi:hypothetical protein
LIHLAKGPGKPVTARSGLTVGPAAVDVNQNVEFILVGGNHQGLAHHKGMFALGKIPSQFLPVDEYFTASIPNVYPGDRGFPSARSDTKILNHLITS